MFRVPVIGASEAGRSESVWTQSSQCVPHKQTLVLTRGPCCAAQPPSIVGETCHAELLCRPDCLHRMGPLKTGLDGSHRSN